MPGMILADEQHWCSFASFLLMPPKKLADVVFLLFVPFFLENSYFLLDDIMESASGEFFLVLEPLTKSQPNPLFSTMRDCFQELRGTTSMSSRKDGTLFNVESASTTQLVPPDGLHPD